MSNFGCKNSHRLLDGKGLECQTQDQKYRGSIPPITYGSFCNKNLMQNVAFKVQMTMSVFFCFVCKVEVLLEVLTTYELLIEGQGFKEGLHTTSQRVHVTACDFF